MDKYLKEPFFVFAIIVVVIGAFTIFSNKTVGRVKAQEVKVEASQESAFKEASRAATPAPAATPSPNYSGFCLNVPVIFYHHVQPMAEAKAQGHGGLTVDSNVFDLQMGYLQSHGYHSISAEQLVNALRSKTGLPAKSIVITIDDGYSDFFTYGFPIMQKYHLVANLAIPTGLLENPGYMSWGQLKQMVNSGLVFAYNHSWSHASLPAGTQEKAQFEIMTAKKQLTDHLGKNIDIFFYPYGSENSRDISLLSQDNFLGAFSTVGGRIQCDSFIFSLHRIRVGNQSLSTYGL